MVDFKWRSAGRCAAVVATVLLVASSTVRAGAAETSSTAGRASTGQPGPLNHQTSSDLASDNAAGTRSNAPSPGFDPSTASDAELQANGYPPRPRDPAELKLWHQAWDHTRYIAPRLAVDEQRPGQAAPNSQSVAPQTSSCTNATVQHVGGNWAGNGALPGEDDIYSTMVWFVPTLSPSYSPDNTSTSATWTGLGTGASNTQQLIQAGVESDWYGTPEYGYQGDGAWFEIYPYNLKEVPFQNFAVYPGDEIWVQVSRSGLTGYFYVNDVTRGYSTNTNETFPNGTDSEAQYIVEDPTGVGAGGLQTDPEAEFGQITIFGAQQEQLNGTEVYIGAENHEAYYADGSMYLYSPSTNREASPGAFTDPPTCSEFPVTRSNNY